MTTESEQETKILVPLDQKSPQSQQVHATRSDPKVINKYRKKAFSRFVREIRPLLHTAEEIVALNRIVKQWLGEVKKRRLR